MQYELKRENSPVHEIYRQPLRSNTSQVVSNGLLADVDALILSMTSSVSACYLCVIGDDLLTHLRKGVLIQLTRSNQSKDRPQFATDGSVIWRAGNDWYHWIPQGGVAQLTDIHVGHDPDATPKTIRCVIGS